MSERSTSQLLTNKMANRDLESRGGGPPNKRNQPSYFSPPYYIEPQETVWTAWLVPMIVVANVAMFIVIMIVNNCPKNNVGFYGRCVARFLGRLSFEPLRENPFLGPLLLLRVGAIYLLSGFGGSILSCLFLQTSISVGASGALFGLLGAMLSELLTNWTIYTNKAAAIITLLIIIAINLAVGILPHVDNFAHIGGFFTGFLLGFVLLIRPQFGWLETQHLPPQARIKSKHSIVQYVFCAVALVLVIAGITTGLALLFRGDNPNKHCKWCHYLSCVPTSRWNCNN